MQNMNQIILNRRNLEICEHSSFFQLLNKNILRALGKLVLFIHISRYLVVYLVILLISFCKYVSKFLLSVVITQINSLIGYLKLR